MKKINESSDLSKRDKRIVIWSTFLYHSIELNASTHRTLDF